MARRLIFKESGLTGSVPSGFKAFGISGATFSQLDSTGSRHTHSNNGIKNKKGVD